MQLTVKKLLQLCMQECKNGNGDRKIVISDDNEGNSYHGLFFGFAKISEEDREFFPIYDSQEEDVDKVIVLG